MDRKLAWVTLAIAALGAAGIVLGQTSPPTTPNTQSPFAGTTNAGGFGSTSSTLGSFAPGPIGSGTNAPAGTAFGSTFTNTTLGSTAIGSAALGSTVVGTGQAPAGASTATITVGGASTADTTGTLGAQQLLAASGVAIQAATTEFFSVQVFGQQSAIVPGLAGTGTSGSGTLELAGQTYALGGVTMAFSNEGSGGVLTRVGASLIGAGIGTVNTRTTVGNLTGVIGSRTSSGARVPIFDAVATFTNGSSWRLLGRATLTPRVFTATAGTTSAAATPTPAGAAR